MFLCFLSFSSFRGGSGVLGVLGVLGAPRTLGAPGVPDVFEVFGIPKIPDFHLFCLFLSFTLLLLVFFSAPPLGGSEQVGLVFLDFDLLPCFSDWALVNLHVKLVDLPGRAVRLHGEGDLAQLSDGDEICLVVRSRKCASLSFARVGCRQAWMLVWVGPLLVSSSDASRTAISLATFTGGQIAELHVPFQHLALDTGR